MPAAPKVLLGALLRDVSRSFYTTLRVLPGKIRSQIGLAYLLARTTDTIADTDLVPLERRLQVLQHVRERILGSSATPVQPGELAEKQSSPAERALLDHIEETLCLLQTTGTEDRKLIQQVLNVITSGQELDLRRFTKASPDHLVALSTDADLDDYAYRVAGCVGEFWTRMCRAHLFPKAAVDDAFLLTNGVRFGKGLQLVNILRDLSSDLRTGRCYVPSDRLSEIGLQPVDLLQVGNESRFRPLFHSYLDLSKSHLRAGWAYTKAIPRSQVRVRLACAWPILIGLETCKLLRTGEILNPERRVKVARTKVKQLMRRSIVLYPFRSAWESLGG